MIDPAVTPTPTVTRPRDEESTLSLVAFATMLLRHRRLLLRSAILGLAILVIMTLLAPRQYAASSRFMPDLTGRPSGSQAASIAAQFGVSLGGNSSGGESLAFYTALVESRGVLSEAVLGEYRAADTDGDTVTTNLIAAFDIEGDTDLELLNRAIEALNERVQVTADYDASLVTLRVRAPSPDLAVQINRRLLELVNRFNVEKRQSRAAAERAFVERRMAEAERELGAAESNLERFLDQNRRYQESPQLVFEARRLEERVNTQLQVYRSLSQSFEQSRIDEVRNIPVVTVLENPEGAARAVQRRLIQKAALGAALGAVIGLGIVLIIEYLARQRALNPVAYRELNEALGSTRGDLPWDRFRRKRGPAPMPES